MCRKCSFISEISAGLFGTLKSRWDLLAHLQCVLVYRNVTNYMDFLHFHLDSAVLNQMSCNKKLNVDEVFEIWDEVPDYSCETDDSSDDEYIPSDHDHVKLTDQVSATEKEGDKNHIVEGNNLVQADCSVTSASSTSSNKGLKKQTRKRKQRKGVNAKEMIVVTQVKLIECFMLENGLTIPLPLDHVKQLQKHLLESEPDSEVLTVAKIHQLSEIASRRWEKKPKTMEEKAFDLDEGKWGYLHSFIADTLQFLAGERVLYSVIFCHFQNCV